MKKKALGLAAIALIVANGVHASAGADEIERARKEKEQTRLVMPSSAIRIIFNDRDMPKFIAWITQNPEYIDAYLPTDIPGYIYKPEMESYNAICFLLSQASNWVNKNAKLLFDFVAQAPKKPNLSCFSAKEILDAAIRAGVSPATLEAIVTILIEQGMNREDLYKEAQLEIERLAEASEYWAVYALLPGWAKVLDLMDVKGLETCGSVLSQSTFPEIKILFQPSNPHLLAIKRAIEDMTESEKQNHEQGFFTKLGRALDDRGKWGKWLELQDETGYTPLLYAAYLDKREAMRYLIMIGANINAKTKDGAGIEDIGKKVDKDYGQLLAEARLERARKEEKLKKQKESIEEGLQEIFRDATRNLFEAINTNNLDNVRRNVERKYRRSLRSYASETTVNSKDDRGRTPLIEAAILGRAEIVSLLLAQNANTALTDNEGNTALHAAIREGDYAIANLIIAKMDKQGLQIKNQNGRTAYDLAMLRVEPDKDRAEQLKLLVETMQAMLQGR